MGRIDNQVKINGYRIEIGEIESNILICDWIKDVAVVDMKDPKGESFLCAYYTVKEKDRGDMVIRSILKDRLPYYMIPEYFIKLEYIPLNINGKLDKKLLPDPGLYKKHVEYIEPLTEAEKLIASVWKDVLNVDKIGIYDDFFDLGGNSIKAIKAATALSENFNISAGDIFENKNIANLSGRFVYDENSLEKAIELALKKEYDAQNFDNILKEGYLKEKFTHYDNQNNRYENMVYTKKEYKNILLTGGTGYLGSYLLKDLISMTKSRVSLIRGKMMIAPRNVL